MLTLTDMFCGCGGSSKGASFVPGVQVDLALNHWDLAVKSHNTNHPNTKHDCADISDTHPARYWSTDILIASPECTNHSLAKGARRKNLNQGDLFQAKEIDKSVIRSRATMWDVPRFAEVHRYKIVIVENVVDVRYWVLYEAWLKAMHSLGYNHECVYLNAMFAHGENITGFVPQSRDRIYIVFWRKGQRKPDLNIRPKAPCPTCVKEVEAYQAFKPNRAAGKYKTQYVYRCSVCSNEVTPYYYAAINAIDFSIPGVRIGDREGLGMRPLRPNTHARIELGLQKHGLKPLLLNQRYGSGLLNRVRDPETEVMSTNVAWLGDYLVQPYLVKMDHTHAGPKRSMPIDQALSTATTKLNTGLVLPPMFMPVLHGTSTTQEVTAPLGCITAGGRNHAIVVAPSALLTMRGPRHLSGMTEPLPTQVAAGVQNWVVSEKPFLVDFTGAARDITADPLPAQLTKLHHGLAQQATKLPKVEDCYFRMLDTSETKAGQGFPSDYVILGNKEKQQRQIGNANPPPTMQLLVNRCVASLL